MLEIVLEKAKMVQYINVFIFALLNSTFLCLIANAKPMHRRNVPQTKGNYQNELKKYHSLYLCRSDSVVSPNLQEWIVEFKRNCGQFSSYFHGAFFRI